VCANESTQPVIIPWRDKGRITLKNVYTFDLPSDHDASRSFLSTEEKAV
jgi:hypothetical protein